MLRTWGVLYCLLCFVQLFLVAYIRMKGCRFYSRYIQARLWCKYCTHPISTLVLPFCGSVARMFDAGCAAQGAVSLAFWDAFTLGAKSALSLQ